MVKEDLKNGASFKNIFLLIISILVLGALFHFCTAELISEAIKSHSGTIQDLKPNLSFMIFALVTFGGCLGGFVHALESSDTHKLHVSGIETDTGAWGHVFIGICGGLVALAVILGIFGMDFSSILNSNGASQQFIALKYTFYILAIGILGGYSGLPIISLISNAALKKVQEEVEQLKKETEKDVKDLKETEDKLTTAVTAFEIQLKSKTEELQKVTLQSILLTAESYARSERYSEAIELIRSNYLTVDDQEHKAYFWLALCEKRSGNLDKAMEYIQKSLSLKKSRIGYFNLACYQALKGYPVDDIISTLKLAWQEACTDFDKKHFKDGLKKDEDFAGLRDKPEFINFAKEFHVDINT